jgi:HlyD family secretion protein
MTANVMFIIAERDQTLKVPNAALRFQPGGLRQEREGQGGGETAGGDRLQALRQRLTENLALTREQQAHLDEILQRVRQQGMQLREQDLTEEERRTRRRALQMQTRTQIRAILTESQRQQYDAWRQTVEQQRQDAMPAGQPGRVWLQQTNGTLTPVSLRLGIADDTFTEVVHGELREGQEVVTGVALAAKRSTSTTPPGFGQRPF